MFLFLVLPALALTGLWLLGPVLIAPVEPFDQGPGGAIAYVSLYNQLQEQAPQLYGGKDLNLQLNEAEFSGMVSSALLSGRRSSNPIHKVRADLNGGKIYLETVLRFADDQVPERYQGPIGVRLALEPGVEEYGMVQFRIAHVAVGRIPIPRNLIQWVGRQFSLDIPGFDAVSATITLPLGDVLANQVGRPVNVKDFTVNENALIMVLSLPDLAQ